MKTITIVLQSGFDEAVIITAMGSAPNGINVTTKVSKSKTVLLLILKKPR